MVHQSTLLEKGYEISRGHIGNVAIILRMYWDSLEKPLVNENVQKTTKYEFYSELFNDISLLFISEEMKVILPKNLINRATPAKNLIKSDSGGQYKLLKEMVNEAIIQYWGSVNIS